MTKGETLIEGGGGGTLRSTWVRQLFRTKRVGDAVRVLLLRMAQDMDDAGRVQVAREELAEDLGTTERRVSGRIKQAVDAGLLERVKAGNRGGAAIFGALLVEGQRVTPTSTLSGSERVTEPSTHSAGKGDGAKHPSAEAKGATQPHPSQRKGDTDKHPMAPQSPEKGDTSKPPSAPPYREEEVNGEVIDASDRFGKTEKNTPSAGAGAPAPEETRTVNQRAQALATVYYEAVGKMTKFEAALKICKTAIESGRWSDEQIEAGLLALVAEKRPLTKNTLPIAIDGLPTRSRRGGSRKPVATQQDWEDGNIQVRI
ncbi:hypothetical protein [Nocardiopsis synnemataformans]|uniref:hypothetical protein n=1 Tax=Nocardiopsis synnemataformans TaxID=61305 RepID=UPI003EB99F79